MRAAGFDFGTSNSAIGIVKDGAVALAPIEDNATMIPSAVFFDFADRDKPHYGRDAIDAYTSGNDGRLMRGLKTILSTTLIGERTALSKRSIPLTDVIAMFARHLKLKAEEALGTRIDAVVHGRPSASSKVTMRPIPARRQRWPRSRAKPATRTSPSSTNPSLPPRNTSKMPRAKS